MKDNAQAVYPVLPLRDTIVFPRITTAIFIGRPGSVKAFEAAMMDDGRMLALMQRDHRDENPVPSALHQIGTLVSIKHVMRLPDGSLKVIVQGVTRAEADLSLAHVNDRTMFAPATILAETPGDPDLGAALARSVPLAFSQYVENGGHGNAEALPEIMSLADPGSIADLIGANFRIPLADTQDLLETLDASQRLEKIYALIHKEESLLEIQKSVRSRVKTQMDQNQRNFYLAEQMKALRKEMDGEEGDDEVALLEERIRSTSLSDEARKKAEAEVRRIRRTPPHSADFSVSLNYLNTILDLPWDRQPPPRPDVAEAERKLNENHYGLGEVKEQIMDHLVVQIRSGKMRGPILCLIGPPGVGKTSLGRSVADAMGRQFVRVSLGGVSDESEIRGHRRTYIGSMPGKIIEAMRKAGTTSPLILLDEIDKMGSRGHHGDVGSALLEVLDPEQNATFTDHYLNMEYDLSDVMFMTTANSYDIPGPLLDRMEIIPISGYTEEEKITIARDHLIPRQEEKNSVSAGEVVITDEALTLIIRRYTREAGVRSLERAIGKIMRRALRDVEKGIPAPIEVSADGAQGYLGVPKHDYGRTEEVDQIGLVNGLAWTAAGGDMLPIEATRMAGKGRVMATGRLGEVMKESLDAASSFVRSAAPELGIRPSEFEKRDIHIHAPEGAVPKDGPSAGLAMVTVIVSAMTDIPIRKDVAMTGEVTLRGNALAIGGLKEKLLAALRAGIRTVIIPRANEKDLAKLPESVLKGLRIVPVSNVREALREALASPTIPISWDEAAEEEARYRRLAELRGDGPRLGVQH